MVYGKGLIPFYYIDTICHNIISDFLSKRLSYWNSKLQLQMHDLREEN